MCSHYSSGHTSTTPCAFGAESRVVLMSGILDGLGSTIVTRLVAVSARDEFGIPCLRVTPLRMSR